LPALDAPKRVGGRVKPGHDAKLLADVSDALEFSLPTANAISAAFYLRILAICAIVDSEDDKPAERAQLIEADMEKRERLPAGAAARRARMGQHNKKRP
jgi:hypothetical protein